MNLFSELDSLSRSILQYLHDAGKGGSERFECRWHYEFPAMVEKLNQSEDSVRAAVKYLISNGYLETINLSSGGTIGFRLTHQGLHGKEMQRIAFKQYLKQNRIAIIALIFSIIALVKSFWPTDVRIVSAGMLQLTQWLPQSGIATAISHLVHLA
jgi:hypothetical protein